MASKKLMLNDAKPELLHVSSRFSKNVPDIHINIGNATRGVTGRGAECPPKTFYREIFCDYSGKMRQGEKVKKWEILRKMRKNGKKQDEN